MITTSNLMPTDKTTNSAHRRMVEYKEDMQRKGEPPAPSALIINS